VDWIPQKDADSSKLISAIFEKIDLQKKLKFNLGSLSDLIIFMRNEKLNVKS
jgi:hypothetical protein